MMYNKSVSEKKIKFKFWHSKHIFNIQTSSLQQIILQVFTFFMVIFMNKCFTLAMRETEDILAYLLFFLPSCNRRQKSSMTWLLDIFAQRIICKYIKMSSVTKDAIKLITKVYLFFPLNFLIYSSHKIFFSHNHPSLHLRLFSIKCALRYAFVQIKPIHGTVSEHSQSQVIIQQSTASSATEWAHQSKREQCDIVKCWQYRCRNCLKEPLRCHSFLWCQRFSTI